MIWVFWVCISIPFRLIGQIQIVNASLSTRETLSREMWLWLLPELVVFLDLRGSIRPTSYVMPFARFSLAFSWWWLHIQLPYLLDLKCLAMPHLYRGCSCIFSINSYDFAMMAGGAWLALVKNPQGKFLKCWRLYHLRCDFPQSSAKRSFLKGS